MLVHKAFIKKFPHKRDRKSPDKMANFDDWFATLQTTLSAGEKYFQDEVVRNMADMVLNVSISSLICLTFLLANLELIYFDPLRQEIYFNITTKSDFAKKFCLKVYSK